ncbi:MAG: hypothetical protein F6K40_00155 [Okeania sp. SIO3I5]|uniref:hypothetical protein n=1 Tax=Okeania sp. SIO3I5 TaxID=2607805 RepID=UPI0013BDDDC9|nr:hypothetical protein [Okeania sp. SIO3I5]NEQ34805.1 hypothetical protein [Okeania sp. SIO3I5]
MILVASEKYKKIGELSGNESEKISGKIIKIQGIPVISKSQAPYGQIFLPTATEYVVNNLEKILGILSLGINRYLQKGGNREHLTGNWEQGEVIDDLVVVLRNGRESVGGWFVWEVGSCGRCGKKLKNIYFHHYNAGLPMIL